MKVICINNKPLPDTSDNEILKKIKEGDEYEVYSIRIGQSRISGRVGAVYYLTGINERPNGLCSTRFMPLSDIDETELVNEREDVAVC